MSFVPELDDPSKVAPAPTNDPSDISSQASTTNIAAAPSAGGQSAAGGQVAAPTNSSGSFQDFSKFKTANQGKLTALSNLATGQAQGGIDKAKSAFDTAGSAFQGEIQKNAKNFETSRYKTLNNDSSIDANAISNDLSQGPVDSSTQQGKLAGTQEYTDLKNRTNQAQQLGTRAGTASTLNDYNTAAGNKASAEASNQDALLLQSMGDYRNKANALVQGTKGADTNALDAQQKNLQQTAKDVNTNNEQYRTKALDALGGLQTNLQKDLTDRAATGSAALQGQYAAKSAEAAKQAAAATRMKAEKAYQDAEGAASASVLGSKTMAVDPALQAAQIAAGKEMMRLRGLADENLVSTVDNDLTRSVNDYRTEAGSQKLTADNIYRDDATRQSQLTALQQLLGKGNSYNAGALNPLESQKLNPLQMLIDNIKNSNLTKAGQWGQDYQPVVPVAPAPAPAPAPKSSGSGTKSGKSTISKPTNQR